MNESLVKLLVKQISNFWDITQKEIELLNQYTNTVMRRCDICMQGIDNRYFNARVLNPLHSGQWCIFLYYFSNTLSSFGNKELADKVYYLNKVMNGIDIYHEVQLPNVFFLEHPVGSVLGRAKYGDNFFAMQHCTVGGNIDRKTGELNYPIIGSNVKMYSGSKVIGKSIIGDNVTLAANTYIKDEVIPNDKIVFGQSPKIVLKDKPK